MRQKKLSLCHFLQIRYTFIKLIKIKKFYKHIASNHVMYSHYKELISLNEKGTKYMKKDQNKHT